MIEAAPLAIALLVLFAGALSLTAAALLFHPDRNFKGSRGPLKPTSLEPSSETRTAAGRMYAAAPFATFFRRVS